MTRGPFSRPFGTHTTANSNPAVNYRAILNAGWEFNAHVPEGPCENSPAFQRWVQRFKQRQVPTGRKRSALDVGSAVPPGLASLSAPQPSVETLGYCLMSLRDKHPLEFPKGVRAILKSPSGRSTRRTI
jgi:hypothetical protein